MRGLGKSSFFVVEIVPECLLGLEDAADVGSYFAS